MAGGCAFLVAGGCTFLVNEAHGVELQMRLPQPTLPSLLGANGVVLAYGATAPELERVSEDGKYVCGRLKNP